MDKQRKSTVKTLTDRPDLAPRWVSQTVLLANTVCICGHCGGMG